jgi:hypothetical protein
MGSVPEGPADRSLAIYCQVIRAIEIRPVRVRYDLVRERHELRRVSVAISSDDHHVSKRIRPFPPGRNLLGEVPGNKLPGYDQLVPPGRKTSASLRNSLAQ